MDALMHDALVWTSLVALAGLPLVASLGVLGVTSWRDRRDPGPTMPLPAGRWLRERVARRRDPVRVEVHPHAGIDAYWPGTGAIGLSERTFGSQAATAWAVAAHELGHALHVQQADWLADLLPSARLARTFAYRLFVGALLAGALFASPALLGLAGAALALSVISGSVILVDEATASRFGRAVLAADPRVGPEARAVAARSMRGAFQVYLAGWLGEVAVGSTLPWLAGHLRGLPAPADAPWPAAVCLAVLFVPALLLRAAHVVHQALRPEPVHSDFRLFTVMHREAQWEFLAGVGVLLVIVGLHPLLGGPMGHLVTVLAATTAVGPVGGLLRALLLVPPLMLAWRLGWLRQEADDVVLLPEARGVDAAPALMALYSAPPWYLRVHWLGNAAYLPMLLLVGARLAG